MPVASPAKQCAMEPTDCFQCAAMNLEWVPGIGCRQLSR